MYKSGKINLVDVCRLIVAIGVLLFMIYLEFRRTLIALVDGGRWKAPQSVVTDLEVMDAIKIAEVDPNRMTAEDAYKTRGLYVVNIRNKGKDKTENTQMSIPNAVHWEVYKEGEKPKNYSKTELIPLPEIPGGRHIDVKVWAACKPTRSHAKKMCITQAHGYWARKDIRTPAWPLAHYLSQHTSKVVKICGIVLFSVLLILIKRPIQKRYLRRKQQQTVP